MKTYVSTWLSILVISSYLAYSTTTMYGSVSVTMISLVSASKSVITSLWDQQIR